MSTIVESKKEEATDFNQWQFTLCDWCLQEEGTQAVILENGKQIRVCHKCEFEIQMEK